MERAKCSRVGHIAGIIQRKQKENKWWNKILLISPGAANRVFDGGRQIALFILLYERKSGGKTARSGRRACGHALGISGPRPAAPHLTREVSPSALPTRKKMEKASIPALNTV